MFKYNICFRTKGNIKKQNETISTPSDVWDDIFILDDGEITLVESRETDFEESQEALLETEAPQTKNLIPNTPLSNITNVMYTTVPTTSNIPSTSKYPSTSNVPNT